jgi:hypothetical protein
MSELRTTEWKHIPLVEIYICLLANKVGVTTSNTLDLRQSVHNLALSVNISVEQTQDVLWMA